MGNKQHSLFKNLKSILIDRLSISFALRGIYSVAGIRVNRHRAYSHWLDRLLFIQDPWRNGGTRY